jgi:hypothetical protein
LDKFRLLAGPSLGEAGTQRVIDTADGLDTLPSIRTLTRLLGGG